MPTVIFIIMVAILILAKSNNCLNNHNLCMKTNIDQQFVCNGQYSHDCGDTKCAQSKTFCEDYKTLSFSLRLMHKLGRNDHELKKFKAFNENIRPCPLRKNLDKNEVNVCLNTKNCVGIRLPYTMITYVNTKKACHCSGKYAHKCSDYLCGRTKKDCAALTKQIYNTIKNKCPNS